MAQLRDLIVTGAARFLNNIYGNLKGNADTADKVNHQLSITTTSGTSRFDGSAAIDLTIDTSTLKMSDVVRIIGIVDQDYTYFDDSSGNGGYVTSNLTITAGGSTTHVIFLQTVISQDCGAVTAALSGGGGNVTYYEPKVGDIVLQDDEEFLCVDKTALGSTWRTTSSTGYWTRYSA